MKTLKFELPNDCAQPRLGSAWASIQSDQSLMCAQWVAKDPSFLHADNEDWSDGGCPGWSELLGTHAILSVLSWSPLTLNEICCMLSDNAKIWAEIACFRRFIKARHWWIEYRRKSKTGKWKECGGLEMLWVLIRITSAVFFIENWWKISFNYHQIPSLSVLLNYLSTFTKVADKNSNKNIFFPFISNDSTFHRHV